MTHKKMHTLFFTLCLLACFFLPSVSARAASPLENGTKNCLELLNSMSEEDRNQLTHLDSYEMKRLELTDEQYQIIRDYTLNLTKDCGTDAKKIVAVVDFARSGTAVEDAPACPSGMNPNSPYAVFKNRQGVWCQGYANLCRTMLASLDIPCVISHGYLLVGEGFEGHAWNYVYCEGDWVVADAAQRYSYMDNLSDILRLYTTTEFEQTIYTENGLEFTFYEGGLGVIGYSGESKELIVPESCHDHPVVSVHPISFYARHPLTTSSAERIVLPKTVEHGIISTQLNNGGSEYQELRSFQSPSLKEIEVAEDNPAYASYKGILYDKNFSRILAIPQALTDVELKPLKVLDKDTLAGLSNPRTVKIAEGTETIESDTFNNFTSLESVYIPASVTVIDDQAFSQCNTDFIIYAPEGSAGAGFAASKGLTLKDPEALEPADYTSVDQALKEVPADLTKYTDETVQKLQAAIDAVNRNLTAADQAEVDRAASAILDAIHTLKEKSSGQQTTPSQDTTNDKKPETPVTETPATEKPALQDPPSNPPAAVNVPTLKKVTGLRVSYKKSGKATLTWKKVNGASGYEIRRLQNGKWVKVKTLKKIKLSIKRNAKKTYQYKVRAYKKSGKKIYYGAYSKKIKIRKI
jgi:hypothetical protein